MGIDGAIRGIEASILVDDGITNGDGGGARGVSACEFEKNVEGVIDGPGAI